MYYIQISENSLELDVCRCIRREMEQDSVMAAP